MHICLHLESNNTLSTYWLQKCVNTFNNRLNHIKVKVRLKRIKVKSDKSFTSTALACHKVTHLHYIIVVYKSVFIIMRIMMMKGKGKCDNRLRKVSENVPLLRLCRWHSFLEVLCFYNFLSFSIANDVRLRDSFS